MLLKDSVISTARLVPQYVMCQKCDAQVNDTLCTCNCTAPFIMLLYSDTVCTHTIGIQQFCWNT